MNLKDLIYKIRAKDESERDLKKASNRLKKFAADNKRTVKAISSAWQGIKKMFLPVVAGITAAAAGIGMALKTAFEFERYETQFKVLFGNLDQAKQHIAELKEFSASTPFQFADIAQASRQLYVFTGGIMKGKEALKLIGDAAAATGTPLQELSMWIGRAYSAIKSGRPWGEAAQRLTELGIISPEVRAEMEDMQAAGASNIEVWNKLQESLTRFNGGMKELSQTGEGLISTLKDNWKQAIAEFGKAFMDVGKNDIKSLSDWLKKLKEDGSIAVWADRVVRFMKSVEKAVGPVKKGISELYKWSGMSDMVATWKGTWAAIGAASTGDFKGMGRAYMLESVKGHYMGSVNKLSGDQWGLAAENKKYDDQIKKREAAIRDRAKKRVAEENAAKTKKEESLNKKIADDMAANQKKIDEKLAKAKAEKEKKAKAKAERELQRQREKDMRELVRAEREGRMRTIRDMRDKLSATQQLQSDAQGRLATAKAKSAQAWSWYRNPEEFKAQLAEEKAQKEAEKQFEKDAKRVMGKTHWQTRKLDARDESVRRVIFARQEEEAAKQALINIENNTKNLASKLDELLKLK